MIEIVLADNGGRDWLTFGLALVGVVLSITSLLWQVTAFRLTGSRVAAEFRLAGRRGDISASAPLGSGLDALGLMVEQGFTRAVSIRVRNTGRLAVSVTDWSITFDNGFGYGNPADPRNPSLPARLEPGAVVTFYADFDQLQEFVPVTGAGKSTLRAKAYVSLATGKTFAADGEIEVPAP